MTIASASHGLPARTGSNTSRTSSNWGTGYYAEGARGSSGWNPHAGDRAEVERGLRRVLEDGSRELEIEE